MAKLIGTAGHVDHGKTTLIQALTGIDADRLPEEKKRGMTIEIGFAHVELPGHGRVSIVDVPGHERFIHNMLVGALGIDVALLCVAADQGVMPQTREHLEILLLLPVKQLVVALTRSDLADNDMKSLVQQEVEEMLRETRFAGAPQIPVSAPSGEGLPELRAALCTALDQAEPRKIDGPWLLPIDRAFTVKGRGVVVTGTLSGGRLTVGEEVMLQPGGLSARVREIHIHGVESSSAEPGQRTAVNLGGLKLEDVRRGQLLTAPGTAFESRTLDARVTWLSVPKHGSNIRLSLGAEEHVGRAFLNSHDPELVQIRLADPAGVAMGQPLILRQASPMKVLGGGEVVAPQARVRRKGQAATVVPQGLSDEEAILALLTDNLKGVTTEEIGRLLGRSPQALGTPFENLLKSGQALGFAGLWFEPNTFQEGVTLLVEKLKALHEKSPQISAHPRERVVSLAGLAWAGKPLDRILAKLAEEGTLQVEGTTIRHPDFAIQLSPKQRAFLDRLIEALDAAGALVPGPMDLARTLNVPPQAVQQIIELGLQSKELIRIDEGFYYSSRGLQSLIEKAKTKLGNRPFSASEFKDAIGGSRKYAIPLLEKLDASRITLRQGDARVFRS